MFFKRTNNYFIFAYYTPGFQLRSINLSPPSLIITRSNISFLITMRIAGIIPLMFLRQTSAYINK